MALFQSVLNLLSTVHLYVCIAIHRVVLFFAQSIEYRSAPVKRDVHRTILLLGDGTAEGIGDSFGNTGLCSRVAQLIRKERDQSGLRMVWSVLTCGRIFSTARDWKASSQQGTTLLHRVVKKRLFADASVVVLLFGMHDDLSDEQVPRDIADIARAVALLGKHVVVAGLPNFYSHKDERYGMVRRANEQLKRLVAQVSEELKASGVSVSCEVDTMKTTAMGAHTTTQQNAFFTLNGNGYRFFARDVYEQLVFAAKRVEWAHWKGRLTM
ncbi:unnamed protein product [Agarophyton chilense]